MSLFSNKLREFLGNNWKNEMDINLNNQLIAQRNNMLLDQVQAQQFISDFMANNAQLLGQCSPEFTDKLNGLTTYVTESISIIGSIMQEAIEYDGVWDTTALEIKDNMGKLISPEIAKKIKMVGWNDFNMKGVIAIKYDVSNPKVMIVPKIKISEIGNFERTVKMFYKRAKINIINLPDKNYNIAAKVNKNNAQAEKKYEKNRPDIVGDEDWLAHTVSPTIHENLKNNKEMKDEQINETSVATGYEGMYEGDPKAEGLFEQTKFMLESEGLAYESNSLYRFVTKNATKVKAMCEGKSQIDVFRIYALMEAEDLKENTTADMSVPGLPAVSSSIVRNRFKNFDPYGEDIANTSDNSKTVIKFDSDVLNESLSRMNIDNITVLATDIETTNKFSRVIVEHNNKKKTLVIDKGEFVDFIKENADVEKYMSGNNLDLMGYIKSRTNAFVGVLLKEYFKSVLKEDFTSQEPAENSINDSMYIDDFNIENGKLIIDYHYSHDTENRRVETNVYNFENFLLDEYKDVIEDNKRAYYTPDNDVDADNPREQYSFDLNLFLSDFSFQEKSEIIKSYMKQTGVGNINEGRMNQTKLDDYNEWKSVVATKTHNNYQISRKSNNDLVTQALSLIHI